jgi:ABC-type transporter Mla subunit MlaD
VLTTVGTALVLIGVIAVALVQWNPFGGRSDDHMSVAIDTPFVGQGIEPGTAVVMHGVTVGQVSNVASLPGGGVRLVADLQKKPVAGLTDTMNIDFRPINYFGVPGVNFIPGPGGQALEDGSQLTLAPKGNFTLSEMLSRLGGVSAGALTPKLITVVDRATRYTDGLNPFFETMLTITNAVADTQRVTTAQLLANTSTASTGFAPFADAAVAAGERFYNNNFEVAAANSAAASPQRIEPPFLDGTRQQSYYEQSEDYYETHVIKFLDIAQNGLFGSVGKLVSSHVGELLPLIDSLKAITDTTPALLRPANFAATITELRTRFERLYGGNAEQRALQVRLVLDSLPAIEAPLGIAVDPNPPTTTMPAEIPADPSAALVSPVVEGSPNGDGVPAVEGTPHGVTVPPVVEGSAG